MDTPLLQYEKDMWETFEITRQEMPELMEAYYGRVKAAVYTDGALPLKTKRLMSLAVAVQAGCKDCMISQTDNCLQCGASTAEIFEACAVAISMGGTLAWSHALVVGAYLRERGLVAHPDDK